jgi:mannan endo-1,4-beta-mannosidase
MIPILHARGVVIGVSSHVANPDLAVHQEGHTSNEGDPVTKVLDRNSKDHKEYMKYLRSSAEFIRSLKDKEGRPIPLLFRPYHEHTGDWFWWGTKTCTSEQYNELWKMTVEFYRDTMQLHNLIYVISPSKPVNEKKYLARFPGFDYVDVLGFDAYTDDAKLIRNCAEIVTKLAKKHNKLAAITEAGYKGGISTKTTPKWFSELILSLKKDSKTKDLSYFMTWSGTTKKIVQTKKGTNNFSPYKDEPTSKHLYPDFIKFYKDSWTLFENNMPNLYKR